MLYVPSYSLGFQSTKLNNVAAYLVKARIAEREETSIAREQHGNITWLRVFFVVYATFPQTGMHAAMEEL